MERVKLKNSDVTRENATASPYIVALGPIDQRKLIKMGEERPIRHLSNGKNAL